MQAFFLFYFSVNFVCYSVVLLLEFNGFFFRFFLLKGILFLVDLFIRVLCYRVKFLEFRYLFEIFYKLNYYLGYLWLIRKINSSEFFKL